MVNRWIPDLKWKISVCRKFVDAGISHVYDQTKLEIYLSAI